MDVHAPRAAIEELESDDEEDDDDDEEDNDEPEMFEIDDYKKSKISFFSCIVFLFNI